MCCFKSHKDDVIPPCVCWCHVYDITRLPVCGVLHGMLVPADEVDDYFEDVIERMMRNENKKHVLCVCSDPQVKKYACSVARFIVLEERRSYARRQKLMQENPEAINPLTAQDEPSTFHAFVTEFKHDISKGLTEIENSVFIMRRREGKTYEQIAEIMGLSVSNVYSIWKTVETKIKGIMPC